MSTKNPAVTMRKSSPDLINYILVSIVIIALLVTAFMTWSTLQHPASSPSIMAAVKSKVTPEAMTSDQTLNLNTLHQHVGPVVQIDSSKIGKDNPFK
jgi:flagellar basal body-associated protein FliL